MKKRKEETKNLIKQASIRIKRLSVESQSKYSELANDLKKVTKELKKNNDEKIEDMIQEIKKLEEKIKEYEIEVEPVLRNIRFSAFKFVEASILRKRLATYMNRVPKLGIIL